MAAVYRKWSRLMVRSVSRMSFPKLASEPPSVRDRGVCIHREMRECSARQPCMCVGVGLLSLCGSLCRQG